MTIGTTISMVVIVQHQFMHRPLNARCEETFRREERENFTVITALWFYTLVGSA